MAAKTRRPVTMIDMDAIVGNLPDERVYVAIHGTATAFVMHGKIGEAIDLRTRPEMMEFVAKQDRLGVNFTTRCGVRDRIVAQMEEMGFSFAWYWHADANGSPSKGIATRIPAEA